MIRLTAQEIMRHGAETEREQSLIDCIERLEREYGALKVDYLDLERAECIGCNQLESEISNLKDILDENGIDYE